MSIDLVPVRGDKAARALNKHHLSDEIHVESWRRCIPMEKRVKPPFRRDRNNEALARSRTPLPVDVRYTQFTDFHRSVDRGIWTKRRADAGLPPSKQPGSPVAGITIGKGRTGSDGGRTSHRVGRCQRKTAVTASVCEHDKRKPPTQLAHDGLPLAETRNRCQANIGEVRRRERQRPCSEQGGRTL